MKAQSIKYYRGTPIHKILLEVAKQVTYTDWWSHVFPNSGELASILTSQLRPNRNDQIWKLQKETT